MKELLEKLLRQRNIKPATFAKAVGLKTSTIDDILKGRTNELNVGVDKAIKIAQGLEISVEELYGVSEHKPVQEQEMILLFSQLNAAGQDKVLEYLNDLVATGKYKKGVGENSVTGEMA